MHPPFIIGLTGPAGSGKDSVADVLVAHAGFEKMAFADSLRTEVMLAFHIDPNFLLERVTKETPLRCLALSRCLDPTFVARMIIMHTLRGERLDLDAMRSPRQIMQWWGTDYRRQQSNSYWVSAFLNRAYFLLGQGLAKSLVVTDCRFQDEVDTVRVTLGGQLWQIVREGVTVKPGSHISEVTGEQFRPNVVINNSHTVKHLAARTIEAYRAGAGLAANSDKAAAA